MKLQQLMTLLKVLSCTSLPVRITLQFLHSILAPDDYTAVQVNITLDSDTTIKHGYINITDDMLCEADEVFEIMLTSLNDNCVVTTSPVPVYIIDNDGMHLFLSIMPLCQ